jgi:hypothetical protein
VLSSFEEFSGIFRCFQELREFLGVFGVLGELSEGIWSCPELSGALECFGEFWGVWIVLRSFSEFLNVFGSLRESSGAFKSFLPIELRNLIDIDQRQPITTEKSC